MTPSDSTIIMPVRTFVLFRFAIPNSLFKMNLAQRIQAKTDNGDTIIDFLVEVMTGDVRDDFKLCHRLAAARLLSRYSCCHKGDDTARSPVADEAISFILDNLPGPSLNGSDTGSADETLFDAKLAMVIREATDDGASVCRFLINVMEGELKAFSPHHRISAARELLDRGFGKHARQASSFTERPPLPAGEGWGESLPRTRSGGEKTEGRSTPSHSSTPTSKSTKSDKSPNPTNQSNVTPYSDTGSDNPTTNPKLEDDPGWAAFVELVTPILDEDDRIKAELAEQDPDNQPHKRDLSAYNEAWDNSEKWFYEWKNSLDPEEYEAIVAKELAEFNAMIDTKIERRKQIKADRERREKEEAERQSAAAESVKADEPEPEPGPPTRSQHRRKLMFELGESIYIDCKHPDCNLHDDDRSRWQGSVQYGAGPTSGHFP